MPSDEYASTSRGGLKLKGAKPTGVEKKKKKKSKTVPSAGATASSSKDVPEDEPASSKSIEKRRKSNEEDNEEELDESKLRELEDRGHDGKTASERAYEETRRKRLADRLARDGPKTHKQRVEELNKYLSNLSEHHDMPRIGPG
ncbi:hypothetical protein B0J14DRAFT_639095 [Halenospora varia]|nr:hypothetical protein B0J14DRAFT_639095 [Halenospora varia]